MCDLTSQSARPPGGISRRALLAAAAAVPAASALGAGWDARPAAAALPQLWLYTGVFRSGAGAQWWRTRLSAEDFKAEDQAFFDRGLRITDLEVEGGRYTGVWRPGSGAQWWHGALAYQDFKALDLAYFNQGLRITDFEIDGGRFFAVWRPGSGAQWWHAGLTWAEFTAQDRTYFSEGLRITDVEVEGASVSAVWHPGTGAQWWHGAVTVDQFVSLNQQYTAAGLRVSTLKVHDGRITAVWRPGAGVQDFRFGLEVDGFVAEDAGFFQSGLRLHALEVHQTPVVVYRLPFDANDTDWKVFNGNWDDPVNGHGKADPTWDQRYAYDFAHDANNDWIGEEGQNVRAARSGEVISMAEDRYINTWGLEEGDPGYGAPGEGNYVLIRHADNTVAAYCHLKYKKVFVSDGQPVARGDVIGLSGNTGNSSTPHLHFDVRAYWNSPTDLGPTVPVHFEDNFHAAWRPSVGDLLSSNNV
jgi:murein DD-endopeptidase MepM/ murein hydrolase activator NlpD